MGAGPEAILAATEGSLGAAERIRRDGPEEPQIGACFSLNRALAEAVRAGARDGRTPVVLAGNCHSAQGTVAGLAQAEGVGVVWFDAHADFNTPETTESGFFDGCALSILTGDCFTTLARGVAGHVPVLSERVVLVGVRDVDAGEEERLRHSQIARVPAHGPAGELAAALDALAGRVPAAYVHLDLDVLDPAEGRANPYATAGGMSLGDLRAALAAVAERFEIRAAALTAYDPAEDPEGRIARAAVVLLEDLARATS